MHLKTRTEQVSAGVWVLSVAGEVDLYTAPDLRDRLSAMLGEGATSVVVDLSEATFIDSTALGVLIETCRRLQQAGGTMAVVCSDPNIVKVFEITALDRLFRIFATRQDALAELAPDGGPAASG